MSGTLEFDISATGQDLVLELALDGKIFWRGNPGLVMTTVTHEFDDTKFQDHCATATLSNKLPHHTMLDSQGNIVHDRVVRLHDLRLRGRSIWHQIQGTNIYRHDGNGDAQIQDHAFFGDLGCNGTVSVEFRSPVLLWMLEYPGA
jgi:hypothetical protein